MIGAGQPRGFGRADGNTDPADVLSSVIGTGRVSPRVVFCVLVVVASPAELWVDAVSGCEVLVSVLVVAVLLLFALSIVVGTVEVPAS